MAADSLEEHSESSLMDTLDLDESLWQKVVSSPSRPAFNHTHSQPVSVPAYCFPSLKNQINHQRNLSSPNFASRASTHQRVLSSMSLKDDEFIHSDQIARPDLKIEPRSPRYSVYLSNNDYEVPEQYQNSTAFVADAESGRPPLSRRPTFGLVDEAEDGIEFDGPKENYSSSWKDKFMPPNNQRGHKHNTSISSIISGVKSRSAYLNLGLKKHKSSRSLH